MTMGFSSLREKMPRYIRLDMSHPATPTKKKNMFSIVGNQT